MELLYLWAENFRNLRKVGFNFSEDFHITFEEGEAKKRGKLNIKINTERNFSFFGENINSVTAIVGENGSGKTNILDLLGVTYLDRVNECFSSDEPRQTYFILYHLRDNLFVMEGIGLNLIKDIVNDLPQDSGIKKCYSFILKFENGKLYFEDFYQPHNDNHNNLAYINIRSNFRNGYNGASFRKENNLFNFDRLNINPRTIGFLQKYKLLLFMKNQGERLPNEKLISYNTDIFINAKLLEKHYEESLQLEIMNDSALFKTRIGGKIKISSNKEMFILKLLEAYIQETYNEVLQYYAEDIYRERSERKEDIESSISQVKLDPQDLRNYYLDILETICDFDEIGYSSSDYIRELMPMLDVIDDKYFIEDGIQIKIETTEEENISKLLEYLDGGHFYKILGLGLHHTSSGEEALINLLAAMHDGINKLRFTTCKRVVLLLDEPDNFMHPEWSRRMMSILLNYLNYYVGGYYIYQLVISTHSPFIISDIPKSSIIALEKEDQTSNCIVKGNEFLGETFAGNIHTLLAEEFFMRSTIGEFAKVKIREAIKDLNTISLDDFKDYRKKEIEFIISTIGEPILKKKLIQLYENKFNADIDLKDKRIKELEYKISLLQNQRELGAMFEAFEIKMKELKEQVDKI